MAAVGRAAAVCSVVEGEEALLQIYELQWRAIEIRAEQLRNQCRQVVLSEELDREERELLLEHEALLRIKEKQILQQQYEDRFRLKEAEATAKKLQRQNEQKRKRQEAAAVAAATETATAVAVTTVEMEIEAVAATIKTKATTVAKSKSKTVVPAITEGKTSATNTINGDGVRRQKKVAAKSVAFSPRKTFPGKTPHSSSHTTRPRSLEESFDTEQDADVSDTPVMAKKKSAADELMLMLSQDKASDTEGEEPSLLLPFSPSIFTPVKNAPVPRYLSYGTPERAEPKGSNNPTPSKFTPSKLAKGVMKKAMAATEDFDFTLRAAKAKAQAEKEARAAKEAQQAVDESDDEEEQATSTETPKKALKRRKDLGISFSSNSSVSNKTSSNSNASSKNAAEDSTSSSSTGSRGGKSLMEMVAAASLAESKIPKPKEKQNQTAKDSATTVPTATATENGKPPLYGNKKPQSKQSAKNAKEAEGDSSSDRDENGTDQSKPKPAAKKATKKDAKAGKSKSQQVDEAELTGTNEPEAEDFIGVKDVNITKRAKSKQQKQSAKEKESAMENVDEPEAEASIAKKKKTSQAKQPKDKGKKKDKLSAAEQAIAKADLLTRMSKMQDIATPKVLTKKKKALSTTAADTLSTKRAELFKHGSAASDSDDASTPRKQRAMKRQLAASRENETTPVKKTAPAPSSSVNHLHSPSITALLAMRPSKSPIGIRYVPKTPKTPKTPQAVRGKRQRPVASNADEDTLNDDSPDAKKRKSRPNAVEVPDGAAAPMSAAEYAAQKLNAGLVTRAQKKVKAARSAFAGTTGALTSAGGGLWGNSGPSFFDAFVNGGAPRLKKSVLR